MIISGAVYRGTCAYVCIGTIGIDQESLDPPSRALSVPPKYSIGQVVGLIKAVSAKEVREEFLEIRKGGKFWEDGYFVRTVGDKVTAEVIKVCSVS